MTASCRRRGGGRHDPRVLLMLGLDQFTPHEHDKTGPCGPGHESCSRVWLFVFAIAPHNLPGRHGHRGSASPRGHDDGTALTTAIALQDIPEGLAVALAMCAAGFRPPVAVLVAIGSGLLEPLGALLGSDSPAAWPSPTPSVSLRLVPCCLWSPTK